MAPGMRLPLMASHDSYGISFSRGPPPATTSAPAAAGAAQAAPCAAAGPLGMQVPQPGQDARDEPQPAAEWPPEGSAPDAAAALDRLSLRQRPPGDAPAVLTEDQLEAPRPTHVPMQASYGDTPGMGAWLHGSLHAVFL